MEDNPEETPLRTGHLDGGTPRSGEVTTSLPMFATYGRNTLWDPLLSAPVARRRHCTSLSFPDLTSPCFGDLRVCPEGETAV